MTGLKEKNQKLSLGVQAFKQTQFHDPIHAFEAAPDQLTLRTIKHNIQN